MSNSNQDSTLSLNSSFRLSNLDSINSDNNSSIGNLRWPPGVSFSPNNDDQMSIDEKSEESFVNDISDDSDINILSTLVENNHTLSLNMVKLNKNLINLTSNVELENSKNNLLNIEKKELVENNNNLLATINTKDYEIAQLNNKIKKLEKNNEQFSSIVKSLTVNYNNAISSNKYLNNEIINQVQSIKKKLNNTENKIKPDKCKICYINKSNIATKPCGHVVMCKECSDKLELYEYKCPLCRQYILDTLKVYLDR